MILYILGGYSWVEPESTMAPNKCWGLKTDAALIFGMHCGTSFLGVFESSSRKIQGPNDHGQFLHFQNPQKHPTFSASSAANGVGLSLGKRWPIMASHSHPHLSFPAPS